MKEESQARHHQRSGPSLEVDAAPSEEGVFELADAQISVELPEHARLGGRRHQ